LRSAAKHVGARVAQVATLLLALTVTALARPAPLGFSELYVVQGVLDVRFTDKVRKLDGETVQVKGFMAPPLKAESDFFVLSKEPMMVCPFCSSAASWPLDIIVVHLDARAEPVDPATPIMVEGRLEVGHWVDPKTGFVSQLRLRGARFREL
jgi:hypothetical protein